jgi:hypothetical protein
MAKSPFDSAEGFCADLSPTQDNIFDIGSPTRRVRNIYTSGTIVADPKLLSNQYLLSTNAAGTGTNNLIKSDASDNTFLNTPTGKVINLGVNGTAVGNISSTAVTYPKFNLLDGSDKNYSLAAYSSGTAYALTATPAALVFGTTSPNLTIDKAGTYLLLGRVNLQYAGATFSANQTVTLKLRRTNNTAADLTNGSTTGITRIITTITDEMGSFVLPQIIYTATAGDIISIFASVAVVPSVGALNATDANIVAIRLY